MPYQGPFLLYWQVKRHSLIALVVALAVAVLVGYMNGKITLKTGIPSFIATSGDDDDHPRELVSSYRRAFHAIQGGPNCPDAALQNSDAWGPTIAFLVYSVNATFFIFTFSHALRKLVICHGGRQGNRTSEGDQCQQNQTSKFYDLLTSGGILRVYRDQSI